MNITPECEGTKHKRLNGKNTVVITSNGRLLNGLLNTHGRFGQDHHTFKEITDGVLRQVAFSGGDTAECNRQSMDTLGQLASWLNMGVLLS